MKAAHLKQRGFSLLEVIFTITVLSVLGAVALGVFSEVRQSTQNATLDSSVAELNKSVNSYVAFGGSVDGARTPAEVFARLKSTASAETADRIAGLSGQFLDPRLNFDLQTASEANRPVPRAYWDPENQRFNITRRGAPGIKRFFLDDNAIPPQATEHRNPSLKLAADDPWIWDYQDHIPSEPPAPVVIPTVPVPPAPFPASSEGYVATPTQLAPPLYSRGGGTYAVTDFPISLSLFNPNPPGSSQITYSIDFGTWELHTGGSVPVHPGSVVRAQAVSSLPDDWSDSIILSQEYISRENRLDVPVIEVSNPGFSGGAAALVWFSVTNPNNPAISRLEYRVAGGSWRVYRKSEKLYSKDFPSGALVEARAVSLSPDWLDSGVGSKWITPETGALPSALEDFCANPILSARGMTAVSGLLHIRDSATNVTGDIQLEAGSALKVDGGRFSGTTIHADPGADIQALNPSQGPKPPVIAAATGGTLRDQAIQLALNLQALKTTQKIGKIDKNYTISSKPNTSINVIEVDEIILSGSAKLTLTGGPSDYIIINVKRKATFKDSASVVFNGVLPSQVIFNLLPGATDLNVDSSATFNGTYLAVDPATKVDFTKTTLSGNLVTGGTAVMDNVQFSQANFSCMPGVTTRRLLPPSMEPPPGEYPLGDFDIPVTLTNPNPATVSRVEYRLNGGAWTLYTGLAVIARPGDTIQTRAATTDTVNWTDSNVAGGQYQAIAPRLLAPRIEPSADRFHLVSAPVVTVQILDDNDAAIPRETRYRINGGTWQPYGGPIPLAAGDYPEGARIEAYVGTGTALWSDSETSEAFVGTALLIVSGNAFGAFQNPQGHSNMLTNLPPGGSDLYFEWGDGREWPSADMKVAAIDPDAGQSERSREETRNALITRILANYKTIPPPSAMLFNGDSFSNVGENEYFLLGSLAFFNGGILNNTGADRVDLVVALNFNESVSLEFTYQLNLINTPNLKDDPIASADIVELDQMRSDQKVNIGGRDYQLQIEFGFSTTEDGFSSLKRFHALEGETAAGNLYGRLVPSS